LQLSHKKISLADAPKFFDASVAITAEATFTQNRQTVSINSSSPVSAPGLVNVTPIPGANQTFIPVGIGVYTTSQEATSGQQLLTNIKNPLNTYSYTGDIDQGNVSTSFSSGFTGDYVRYIQFTLSCAGYRTTINSNYDSETVNNVKAFQTASGILSDGVVDSQTKSYLGLFWGNLYKEDRDDYNGKFALVKNNNVKKYITAARDTILADDALGTETPVKLINFTGVAQSRDPEEIQLWISFQILDKGVLKKLNSITITPEDFSDKAASYNGIQILDYRFDQEPTHRKNTKTKFIDRSDKNAPLTIIVDGDENLGKYVSILIKGSPLGGSFGSKAEGIGIKSISYEGITQDSPRDPNTNPSGETQPSDPTYSYSPKSIPVNGTVTLTLPVKNISATNKTFIVDKNILLQLASLSSIEIYKDDFEKLQDQGKWPTYTGLSGVTLNQAVYEPGSSLGRKEKVDLSNPINIKITSVSVVPSSIKESGNSSNTFYSNSFMDIVPVADSNIFSCVVRASTYPSPNTYNFGPIPIANYKLKSAINGNIKAGTNTINFYDGPMLICNDDGSPYTINISNIANASPPIPNTASVYNSDLEVTSVSQIDPGLKYGFYDSVTSKFIGTKISYNKYIQNAANIYVAVYAYDYDGNLETISESTSLDQDTIIPAQVPIKTAYPVYLLRTSNINKIQLRQTQKNLDKTEPWPIMISSGSFYKNIFVPRRRAPGSDVSLTVGMELVAKYDTSSSESAAPSKLFGKKYYDVVDETPEIINRYSIKTKQTPIHYIHEIPSDLIRFVTPINAIVSVYTRLDEDSAWQLIPKNKIQDINCKTGLIKFIDPLISSDENLTKVSYTIKMNNIMFKHSNGVPIPTNPFLNRDQIRINKPLYIYLLPKEVYQESSAGLEIVEEYSSASIVNFTYDNNIFNKLDVFNYNPYALLIGIVYTVNNFRDEDFTFTDLRTKGGGVSANFDTNQIISDIKESISYWDVYPPLSEAYPKGGYVIIKVPTSIKRNFTNPDEVYRIVKDNITAGVVFELQDMDGKDWGSSVTVPS
jgi:peptidoglycan hydrolase-like protein with peptidoglycan-binding domain